MRNRLDWRGVIRGRYSARLARGRYYPSRYGDRLRNVNRTVESGSRCYATGRHLKNPTTEQWARSFGISTAPTAPPVTDYDEACPFGAREVATRAIVLQGVVAVACEVDSEPIIEWFKEQRVWNAVSPKEQAFLLDPKPAGSDNLWCQYFQTRREHPESLPSDLNLEVLYQREYAFEWLQGIEAWDDVQCDA